MGTTIPAGTGGGGLGSLTAPVVKSTAGVASAASPGTDYTGPSWFSARLAEAQVYAPTLDAIPFATDCGSINTDVETAAATGTGLAQSLTTEDGGVFQIKSGATASSLQIIRNKNGTASPAAAFVSNCKTKPWAVAVRAKITTTPDANTNMLIACLSDSAVDHIVGVKGGSSTSKFYFWINNVSSTLVDTTVNLITGTYFNLVAVFDGTTLRAIINGTVAGGTLTDLTQFGTNAGYTRMYAANGATAANQEFHVDKWAVFAPSAT